MTRKDYILIASALREEYLSNPSSVPVELRTPTTMAEVAAVKEGILRATFRICVALELDNPRFDREHFLAVVRGEKELHSRPSRNGRQS
jgi:hypothetical protein